MRTSGLLFVGLLLIALSVFPGCAETAAPEVTPEVMETDFVITSSAFADGSEIPVKYSCHGQNVSPPLDWSQGPSGTASLALIVEDLDAPIKDFTHWVIFNLPPDVHGLPEAVPKDDELPTGALQGKGGTGKIGYFGPCPPKGSPHRYRFTLYALDTSLDLTAGATKAQVLQAMEGHILAQSQLIGVYQR